MRQIRTTLCLALAVGWMSWGQGQQPRPKRNILVIGAARGFEHDSIPDAMGTVWNLGRQSGLWEAYLRTDYELLTKKDIGRNAKNLKQFDAVVFASPTGEMTLSPDQKQDLLSYVHDDGKGFVGIHAALDGNYEWPEYADLIGGWFDDHPWNTFDAPIVVEDPTFPAVQHFPRAFTKRDEIYQPKHWSRDQMVEYFHKYTAMDEPNIQTEVDRYIAWPGQALAYKLGQLEILKLGERARQKLGPKFDIRAFHDEVLGNGALPLNVLDEQVEAWISSQARE